MTITSEQFANHQKDTPKLKPQVDAIWINLTAQLTNVDKREPTKIYFASWIPDYPVLVCMFPRSLVGFAQLIVMTE